MKGFYVFPAITFGLGTWQIYRWDRKQKMLAFREERRLAEPKKLPEEISPVDEDELEFTNVHVKGSFDHSKTLEVGPRSFDGESGFFVLAPFLTEHGKRILVNRGWAPKDCEDYKLPAGKMELRGVVRKSETPTYFTPDNDLENGTFYWLDHSALKKMLHLDYNVRLDQVKGDAKDEPPIGGQTVYWMPNNHVTYIATWYSLTAALLLFMKKNARIRP